MNTLTQAVKDGILSTREAKIASLVAAGLTIAEAVALLDATSLVKPAKSRTRVVGAKNKSNRWTQAETDELLRLWATGATMAVIAKKLRRTPSGVNVRITKLRRDNPNSLPRRKAHPVKN